MKKRILYIVSNLDLGGAEQQMCRLARGLPRDEFEVHVCAIGRRGPLADDLVRAGIPLTTIDARCGLEPLALWRTKQHVARLRPDVIHAWRFAAAVHAAWAARLCGVRHLVVTAHGVDPSKNWGELALERCVARQAAVVVVKSAVDRHCCVRRGLPAEKIRVIPNGVPSIEPSNTTRRQLLAELGLPENIYLVGMVGRFVYRKRLKDAIWAADLLKVVRDDVHLLLVGDGPQRQRLYKFRDQVRIPDKVHFLGSRRDLPRLLPHLDVFWSTSVREGQSTAVLEAMAAGLPVVASDIAGTRDLVLPETTGYLVPVGDRAGGARSTIKLLDNPELRSRMGQAGRERAEREFSLEKMVARHAELYRAKP